MEKDYSKEYQSVADDFARRVSERLGHVIRSVTLFGSVARGQADPDSDIDVLVVMNGENPENIRDVYDIALDVELEHRAPLAVKVFSEKRMNELTRLKTPFTTTVMEEGKTLWIPKP